MKDTTKKPATENPMKDYNPQDRDFQKTEEDLDNISGSEREALNKKTADANTKPDKEKMQ